MTLPMEPPQVQPAAPPVPLQVIGYASGGTISPATAGVRVLLGFLSAFHLLLGGPLIVWIMAVTIGNISSGVDAGAILVATVGMIVGGIDVACGIGMLVRRPWTWRAVHVGLTMLCVLELLVCVAGAGFCIAFKGATEWEALGLIFGIVLAVAGTGLFWLHALSKLALLRVNVRRAFFLGEEESTRWHHAATLLLIVVYGLVLVVGGAWYIGK